MGFNTQMFNRLLLTLALCLSAMMGVAEAKEQPLRLKAKITAYWRIPREDAWTHKGLASTTPITGKKLREGRSCAADPDLYPPGTIVRLPDGTFRVVDDQGSEVQGNHFDIFFDTKKEGEAWLREYGGRKLVVIYRPRIRNVRNAILNPDFPVAFNN
jgi:3D (Asp-Asp-Asp) domain-containing protein